MPGPEWIWVIIAIVVLFGASRLPAMGRNVGLGIKEFKKGVTEGKLFPVTCGIATKNLGSDRLLEALLEDLPSPAMRGAIHALGAEDADADIAPEESGDIATSSSRSGATPPR